VKKKSKHSDFSQALHPLLPIFERITLSKKIFGFGPKNRSDQSYSRDLTPHRAGIRRKAVGVFGWTES